MNYGAGQVHPDSHTLLAWLRYGRSARIPPIASSTFLCKPSIQTVDCATAYCQWKYSESILKVEAQTTFLGESVLVTLPKVMGYCYELSVLHMLAQFCTFTNTTEHVVFAFCFVLASIRRTMIPSFLVQATAVQHALSALL